MTGNTRSKSLLVNGCAYPSIAAETLSAWLPDLTFVSSFAYGFTAGGDLIDLADGHITGPARAAGVEPLMVLAPLDGRGHFDHELTGALLASSRIQDRFIRNLLDLLTKKQFLGVVFAFECISAKNRDAYTALVYRIREHLNRAGHLVIAALAPKTAAHQPGLLYEGHDYAGMAQAANFVVLMTYEWGYAYGPPLAIAPLPQIRQVLAYGVSAIPADQILMGIPNYGYDWQLPFIRGETRAEKISGGEALARAERYGVPVQFDETAQSPYYYYTDEQQREHAVWFEDVRSLRAKLELVSTFDLAGISYWNIMNSRPPGAESLHEQYPAVKL